MASITQLPCEIVVSILRELDNLSSLLSSLLSCRYVYESFKESRRLIADIVERQITPALVPYAVATDEAERLKPHTGTTICKMVETLHKRPTDLANRLPTMTIPMLVALGRKHDLIHSLVAEFSGAAWARLTNDDKFTASGTLSLSPAEYTRFCRAFYRFELFFNLFRRPDSRGPQNLDENTSEWFFSKHTPWENEQIAAINDFMELKLSKACYEVCAHDVLFGEFSIDYISSGDNYSRQLWLSQGLEYLVKLENETSYEARKAMLESAWGARSAYLWDALIFYYPYDTDDNTPLSEYTDEDLLELFSGSGFQDAEKGPFEAWRQAFGCNARNSWGFMIDYGWFRERAYVFWDMDRLEGCGLLEAAAGSPEESELQKSEKDDHNIMEQSFKERSKIWQKGGLGYWSKGDTSRIEWPRSYKGE